MSTSRKKTRLPIWSEKPSDVASQYAISSSVPEAAKNDDEKLKRLHQSHGKVLEKSRNSIISCGNRSSENASMEQEVSRYQTCNIVTALQGDKNDADCTRSNDSRPGLHEDLLFDIMLWLPVASLLRFRSVCRLWCSLIDSSTFITQHYNHNSNKSCLLARHRVSSYDDAGYNYKFCLLSGNKYEVYSNMDYEQPWCSVDDIIILNSCNGIVPLLNRRSGNFALWNPATKQLRPLPESSISRPLHCYGISVVRDGVTIKYGFGFDAKSNDYKFVEILSCVRVQKTMVEVYNLSTDSWRIMHKDDVLPFQYMDSDATICKYGRCFWTGYTDRNEFSPILISFDFNNEVFETMPLPGERDPDHCTYAYKALDFMNDKLCYIRAVQLGSGDIDLIYFEIWKLEEYGVKESWKKICKVGPIGSSWKLPDVLGFSKNGEFLLLGNTYRCGELYLSDFDAREEEHHELQIPNPILSDAREFVYYNESLVSLKREDDGADK